MKSSKATLAIIKIPSFLRKVQKAYALKAEIRSVGCELQRIGRSRNWQLKASFEHIEHIIALIEQANEPSWQWLAAYLTKQQRELTYDELMRIASKNNGVTVNQLMKITDCTIAQARKVIDDLEFPESAK